MSNLNAEVFRFFYVPKYRYNILFSFPLICKPGFNSNKFALYMIYFYNFFKTKQNLIKMYSNILIISPDKVKSTDRLFSLKCLNGLERPWMALNGLERPWTALNGLEWPWMALNGLERPWMALNGRNAPGCCVSYIFYDDKLSPA